MRTGGRVPKEAADALVQFWADNVLEFAGLSVRLVIVDSEGIFEKPLCKPVAANHVARAAFPSLR